MPIREALAAAIDAQEETQGVQPAVIPDTPEPVAAPTEVKTVAPVETEEQKAGRTAGRPRDEHGRLLPGKVDKPVVAAPVEAAKPKVAPPSSWKKDHWESWEKISTENPSLAEYLMQREGEFAKGVSTYKTEYDTVRPLAEAVQPYMADIQRHGVQPHEYVSNILGVARQLAHGSHQDKIQVVQNILANNGVQAQLAVQDAQGQWQLLAAPQRQQQPQPTQQQPDVRATVTEILTEERARGDLESFQAAKDTGGNPLYPHYETVRNTMAQLLDANLAPDLKSAYDKAIRMHDDIWDKEQAAKSAAALKASAEAQAKQVAQAKSAAVSTRTATPAAQAAQANKGSRRDAIAAAVDANTNGERV